MPEIFYEEMDKMFEELGIKLVDTDDCKCQHTFVQKVENFFVQLPVLCFSLLSL